jgi:hypothetical protein
MHISLWRSKREGENMQCRMDKRVIELLNEAGISITWEQFRTAYDRRRNEREADPLKPVRRARREAEDTAFEAFLDRITAPKN